MGKKKWAITGASVAEADDSSGFEPYEGPELVAGVYTVVVDAMKTKTFNSGNEGLDIRFKVDVPKGHRQFDYNGAAIFDRIAVIDSQRWKVKQLLTAMGGTGAEIDQTVEDSDRVVTRLGRLGNPVGHRIKVALKNEPYVNDAGQTANSMKVSRYMKFEETTEDKAAAKVAEAKAGKKSKKTAPEQRAPEPEPEATAPAKKGGKKAKKGQAEDPPF